MYSWTFHIADYWGPPVIRLSCYCDFFGPNVFSYTTVLCWDTKWRPHHCRCSECLGLKNVSSEEIWLYSGRTHLTRNASNLLFVSVLKVCLLNRISHLEHVWCWRLLDLMCWNKRCELNQFVIRTCMWCMYSVHVHGPTVCMYSVYVQCVCTWSYSVYVQCVCTVCMYGALKW